MSEHELPSVCPCCGLMQAVPALPPGTRACCARCQTSLRRRSGVGRGNSRAASIALAALILYPLAVSLPMLKTQQLGHHAESSILGGIAALLADGQLVVGVVVLLCSVIFPLGKLLALLVLTTGVVRLRHRHRAITYRIIEWTGRWGMLDVLLVAILVAVLKLGDFIQVSAGPAALAFTACVVLSLLATAFFDPHGLWEAET